MKKPGITLAFVWIVQVVFAQHLELKADLLMPFFKTASLSLEITTDDNATTYQLETIYKGGIDVYSVSIPVFCIDECYPFRQLPYTVDVMVLMPSVRHYMSYNRPKNTGWFMGAYLRSDILLASKNIKENLISVVGYNRNFRPGGGDIFLRNALGISMGNKWMLTKNLFVELGIGFDYEPHFQDSDIEDVMAMPSCKVSYRIY